MAIYKGDIETYGLRIGSPNEQEDYRNTITIRGSFGQAKLFFVQKGGCLGINRRLSDQKQNSFDVYFWLYYWQHIVDMIRNEKPVEFLFDDSDNTAVLRTDREPIGENE